MKQLNQKEQEQLQEAFNALCNIFFATEKDNFSKCSSFHIKPFNTHWDKKTVKEVMYHVKLYLGSWVIHPMEQALKEDRNKVKRNEQKRHREAQKIKKEWMANLKRKSQ